MSMEYSMNLSLIQEFLEDSSFSEKNADPANWTRKVDRGVWRPADESVQKFYDMCRVGDDSQLTSLFDPNSPLFALPFLQGLVPEISPFLIRSSYLTMFDVIWAQSVATEARRGVLMIGQPGTGKTLFHIYLLTRLLVRKQVVIYSSDGETVFLFYHDGVYTANMSEVRGLPRGDMELPKRKTNDIFIWSLFDIREEREPPPFLVNFPCFPVQITSPSPKRYRSWKKHSAPMVTGLPLWTRDELAQGLQYQVGCNSLEKRLAKVYGSSPSEGSDHLISYPVASELLDKRFSKELQSPQEVLDYFLDCAIERFGYSPRNVFNGIFDYERMICCHESAFELDLERLRDSAYHLATHQNDDYALCARIFVFSPLYDKHPLGSADWKIDFKSDWIARNIIQRLGAPQDDVIPPEIGIFHSRAQAIAGRLHEPLVHRSIASATDGFWPLGYMDSNNADPPLFTFVPDIPVPDTVKFVKVERKVVKLESITGLSSCLEHNAYYIPTDPTFPFFDAFTVELDHATQSGILWILQVTTSRMQGGSTLGYKKIREIIAIVQDELRGDPPLKKSKVADGKATSTPSVEVRYLLVVPKLEIRSKSQDLQRQFPKGWGQDRETYDHCGNVYYLENPIRAS